MRIPRIYYPEILSVDSTVTLTQDAANHVANVLRLKEGHPIVLFNGDNNEYSAELFKVNKRHVEVLVDAKLSLSVESPLSIHLGQGVSRGDRMDMVLQKSVELGVAEITPLITERCGVKLSNERWQKKYVQWKKIISGACEQSGRNLLPILHPAVTLGEWMKESTKQTRITLHPGASTRLRDISCDHQGIRLLIGPEGGLSEHEVYSSEQAGFHQATLGPRVLRTETAALTSISIIQGIFGDI